MHNHTQHNTAGKRHKRPGGQPGNTNGQKHGLFSTITPPTVQDLRALADGAIEAQDIPQLQRIERAAKFHATSAPNEMIARPYRQAEKMIRAARALLGVDQRSAERRCFRPDRATQEKENQYEEDLPVSMQGQGGGVDDWPADEPFANDAAAAPQPVSEWSTTHYPIAEQQAVAGLPDPPPMQPSIFHGHRDARGKTTPTSGGQDAFPTARRRH